MGKGGAIFIMLARCVFKNPVSEPMERRSFRRTCAPWMIWIEEVKRLSNKPCFRGSWEMLVMILSTAKVRG